MKASRKSNKIHYGTCVEVTTGFYTGWKGTIIQPPGRLVFIRTESGLPDIVVHYTDINIINCKDLK